MPDGHQTFERRCLQIAANVRNDLLTRFKDSTTGEVYEVLCLELKQITAPNVSELTLEQYKGLYTKLYIESIPSLQKNANENFAQYTFRI